MAELIPPPDLDVRSSEEIAAQAIARVSGPLTVAHIDSQLEALRCVRVMVAAGALAPPACPELTNASYSSPHTMLLETQAWLVGLLAYRINQLPRRDQIEFARLFGIELRAATPATTTLEFVVEPPPAFDVFIPAGTQVGTNNGQYIFATLEDLFIPYGTETAAVAAERTVAGVTQLAPGVVTRMLDNIAWVTSVTNPDAVESGSEEETVDEALERARNYQRRGERLVSARDMEEAIFEDVLFRNGIVRVFPFIKDGDWVTSKAGHTTIVVMTRSGAAVSAETKQAINAQMQQVVGNQFIWIKDPAYVDFNVTADIKTLAFTPQLAAVAAVERALRDFYAPERANFGRSILRSEIIALIEGTAGVDRIEPQVGGEILISPAADVDIAPYEIPRLVNVTINVVP